MRSVQAQQTAARVLRAGLPGAERLPRSVIDAVLASHGVDESGSAAERALRAAAVTACLVLSGAPLRAVALADRSAMEALWRASTKLAPDLLSAGYVVMGGAYLLNGRCSDAAECARIADDYARESGDDGSRYRALALRAAAAAQNGQMKEASDWIDAATDLAGDRGWNSESSSLAWASVHLGYRDGDVERVSAAVDVMRACSDSSTIASTLYKLGRVFVPAARHDLREVSAAADEFLNGVTRATSSPFLNDLALSLKALALIDIGELHAAMKLVGDRQSMLGHPVCFELLRANIYLRLGEPRKAIRETEACVGGEPHNLRPLPSVLLRRAIAYEQLGHTDLSDAEFSKATHLASSLGSVRQSVGLPPEELRALFFRFLAHEKEYSGAVTAKIDPEGTYEEPEPLDELTTHLTQREAVLADWLPTSLVLTEIAGKLGISINTLKTQTRSLYKKIGAVNREDAVTKLERAGFYVDRQPPDRS